MKSAIFRLALLLGAAVFAQNFVPSAFVQTGFAQTARPQSTPAAQPALPPTGLTGFPFSSESLAYTVNWPSGLSMGEGHLSATGDPSGWKFELALDAGIPGFAVKDTFGSSAGADLCSASMSKDSVHGTRRSTETVTIDKATATATRTTTVGDKSGGTSKVTVPDCVRDALTYLFYTRREMGQGRTPPAQQIIFGALYDVSLQYAGSETLQIGTRHYVTDKMVCRVKGPASDIQFDAYFDRDPARTPVAIRVPMPIGKISLELVR